MQQNNLLKSSLLKVLIREDKNTNQPLCKMHIYFGLFLLGTLTFVTTEAKGESHFDYQVFLVVFNDLLTLLLVNFFFLKKADCFSIVILIWIPTYILV